MFPEYRDLISHLRQSDPHFRSLFDKHNQLDHEISRLEHPDRSGYNDEVVELKKQKLRLKEEIHQILKTSSRVEK
ncbi:YdcH family protein [Providencia rettgeri]|uniref:YdcH family protein n=1 Tax=Providencia rettgeri TaxID=587 RepID=UPI0034E07AA6